MPDSKLPGRGLMEEQSFPLDLPFRLSQRGDAEDR